MTTINKSNNPWPRKKQNPHDGKLFPRIQENLSRYLQGGLTLSPDSDMGTAGYSDQSHQKWRNCWLACIHRQIYIGVGRLLFGGWENAPSDINDVRNTWLDNGYVDTRRRWPSVWLTPTVNFEVELLFTLFPFLLSPPQSSSISQWHLGVIFSDFV